MSLIHRLYISRIISGLGSWLTFLATALLIKEEYGTDKVAYAFLISSLGPLFLSNYVSKIIPKDKKYPSYVALCLLSALNVLALTLNLGLWQIYVYLSLASIIGTFTQPIFMSLVGEWVEREKLQIVHLRLGSIQACLLALAPPLGGFISTFFGFNLLFLIDAATFVIAILFLIPRPKTINAPSSKKTSSDSEEEKTHNKLLLPSELRHLLVIWYLFLCLGAALNALEFEAFSVANFSRSDIGLVIGGWGIGALIAFIYGKKITEKVSLKAGSWFLVIAFLTFALSKSVWVSISAFVVGSMMNSFIAGSIRGKIQNQIPESLNPLDIWSLINKRLSIINVTFYGGIGFLIPKVDYYWIVGLFFIVGLAYLVRIQPFKDNATEKSLANQPRPKTSNVGNEA